MCVAGQCRAALPGFFLGAGFFPGGGGHAPRAPDSPVSLRNRGRGNCYPGARRNVFFFFFARHEKTYPGPPLTLDPSKLTLDLPPPRANFPPHVQKPTDIRPWAGRILTLDHPPTPLRACGARATAGRALEKIQRIGRGCAFRDGGAR